LVARRGFEPHRRSGYGPVAPPGQTAQ
jgi:hypothetical protein